MKRRLASGLLALVLVLGPWADQAQAQASPSLEEIHETVLLADQVLAQVLELDQRLEEVVQEKEEEKRQEEERKKKEEEERKRQEKAQASRSNPGPVQANKNWDGSILTKSKGVNYGPTGKETYYNLPMDGVIRIMRRMGNQDEYWVREDGAKMLGDYIMVAANLQVFPRGSLVETSMGTGIVCDTGGFAAKNPTQVDIAVSW